MCETGGQVLPRTSRPPSKRCHSVISENKNERTCRCEELKKITSIRRASLVAQVVKNLPPVQETQVRPLGQDDPLEEGMVTHSRILAWRTPWTEEPGGLQSVGSQRVRHD